MEVRADSAKFYEVEADALVVMIYEGEKADDGALKELDERTGGIISEMLGSDEMRGKQGDMVYVYRPGQIRARRLLLVGAGKRELPYDAGMPVLLSARDPRRMPTPGHARHTNPTVRSSPGAHRRPRTAGG